MPVAESIFQDNNAEPHRLRIVNDYLQVNNVNRRVCPAISPDLSYEEHGWDVLASRKHAYIVLTPLNHILHSNTGVYRGIHYFFLISAQKQSMF